MENDFRDDPECLADVICYLAQQATEKLLKGYLVYKHVPPVRTHDLMFLLSKCIELDDTFGALAADLRMLNAYSVEARYPGDYFGQITAKDAEAAYQSATRVKDFVRVRLPSACPR